MHNYQIRWTSAIEVSMAEKEKITIAPSMKVVIGAATLLLGLIFGLGLAVALFMLQLKTPGYQKSVAVAIADFSEPLPAGFTVEAGSEIGSMKTITFAHKPDYMSIVMNVSDVRDDAEMKEMEEGIARLHSSDSYNEKDAQHSKIADRILEYRTRAQKTSPTHTQTVLDGKIIGIPNRIVTFTAFSDSVPFDFKLFQQFTDSIKSFKAPSKTEPGQKENGTADGAHPEKAR